MRVVAQRVSSASVRFTEESGRERVRTIGPGLAILVGVGPLDSEADARRLADRLINLRIFADEEGRFNRSLLQTAGEALVVSQFTLYADATGGRRPSFAGAAAPELASRLYETFAQAIRDQGVVVTTGSFGSRMTVSLDNEGPVTMVMSTDDWATQG